MKLIELSDEEKELLNRLVSQEWWRVDKERMRAVTGSSSEREALTVQQVLEGLEVKLR